jgi:putative ABC transport system ATP-binding protein
MPQDSLISLDNITKSYAESGRRHLIFQELNFTVAPGEFVVLLGRSGSGKSTFLNLLSGIDPPDSGRITIDGTVITGLPERDRTLFRRHRMGFIFQSYNLIPTLTVAENLLLPLELIGCAEDAARPKVQALLDRLELSERWHSYPDRLSGGEQQRVAIARALVHDPVLILADEPTGNLDLETAQSVLALLDDWVKQAGKTLIMATHSLEMIGKADRVVRIVDKALQTL